MIIPIDYVSPTSFTDLDMDWSDESTDISAQKSKYLDALRLAILERQSVLNITSLDILYTPNYIPYPYKTLDYDLLIYMHNAIRTLIPHFVNHTVNNGDFTGLDSIPMWNERDLLDYLQIEEYQYPQPFDMDNNEWLKQQYKIINLLRYTAYVCNTFSKDTMGVYQYPYSSIYSMSFRGHRKTKGELGSWDECLNVLKSSNWNGKYDLEGESYIGYLFDVDLYRIEMVQYQYIINPRISCLLDFYSYRSSNPYGGNGFLFQECSISDTPYVVKKSFTENNYFNFYLWNEDDFLLINWKKPMGINADYHNAPKPVYRDPTSFIDFFDLILLKYTGPNGFKFRGTDW